MNLVRLFKIGCCFCKKLVVSDADVDGETECITDFILDGVGCGCWIRIDEVGSGHVEKTLIDGKLFEFWRIFPADFDEALRAGVIPGKIGRGDIQAGAFLDGG